MKVSDIRCVDCPYLKKQNINNKGRAEWYCTHPDAKLASKLFCPKRRYSLGFVAYTYKYRETPDIKTNATWCPRRLQLIPREITKDIAYKIIKSGRPHGTFYLPEGEGYTAVDSRGDEVDVEEFKSKTACIRWLRERNMPIEKESESA